MPRRRSTLPADPPFPGCEGRWVRRKDFPDPDPGKGKSPNPRKTFGIFHCHCAKCKTGDKPRQWTSAHAFKCYGQECTKCQSTRRGAAYVLPTFLWVNGEQCRRTKSTGKSKQPHFAELCEACRQGKCNAVRM